MQGSSSSWKDQAVGGKESGFSQIPLIWSAPCSQGSQGLCLVPVPLRAWVQATGCFIPSAQAEQLLGKRPWRFIWKQSAVCPGAGAPGGSRPQDEPRPITLRVTLPHSPYLVPPNPQWGNTGPEQVDLPGSTPGLPPWPVLVFHDSGMSGSILPHWGPPPPTLPPGKATEGVLDLNKYVRKNH